MKKIILFLFIFTLYFKIFSLKQIDESLMSCSLLGDTEGIDRFIDQGANVNCKDTLGNSPLSYAAANGHLDAVIKLLHRGAKTSDLAFLYAVQCGYADIVKTLYANTHIKVNKKINGKLPLAEASSRNHMDITDLLLRLGADANKKDDEGKTALMKTVEYSNDINILAKLYNCGAKINKKDKFKNTVLMLALAKPDMVGFLLSCGAKLNNKNKLGKTELGLIINRLNEQTPQSQVADYIKSLCLLLDNGADLLKLNPIERNYAIKVYAQEQAKIVTPQFTYY